MRTEVAPGIKTPSDIFKAQGLILGGLSADGTKDLQERLALEVLGINDYKYVTGFSGAGLIRAAVQQKFVNLYLEATSPYLSITVATMVKDGEVLPLFSSGAFDKAGNGIRDARTPDLPTLVEFYRAKYGHAPSGLAWDTYSLIHNAVGVALNGVLLPPGSPQAAIDAMQGAVDPMNNDPDFIAASDKARGVGTRESAGPLVQKEVVAFANMRPDLRDKYFATIKSGEAMAEKKH